MPIDIIIKGKLGRMKNQISIFIMIIRLTPQKVA
jgi:hypothetical protein